MSGEQRGEGVRQAGRRAARVCVHVSVCVCADTPGESALAGVHRTLGQRSWEKEGRRLNDG